MCLKTKILAILFGASIAASIITGFFLIQLLGLFGITNTAEIQPVALPYAIMLSLLGALCLLALLNILLGKNVIIPAVEQEFINKERTILTRQLHHAQKMEAVGKLAGSIAHDFNNLLTIIDGYSSLIKESPNGEQTEQHAAEIVEAARKASFITRKLLSFSRKEQNDPVVVDMNIALQDTEKMLSRLLGEKITLIVKTFDTPIYVMIDPIQIGQLLMNLSVNARDAMPNGGRISIRIDCRQIAHGEYGKPPKFAEGRYVEIAVHDTGCGIEEEMLKKVFEPFFTTKEEDKGSGLGLAIVKSIMKDCKGFVQVESTIGVGTTFHLYLPEITPEEIESEITDALTEATERTVEEPALDSATGTGATILLAEDDEMIRNLIQQTLEKNGYTVLVAEDGWEGIKIARTHRGRIDMLFADIVMPGLGGAELALALRELYPQVKILFMSGYSRAQLDAEEVPPCAELIEKPFSPDKVLSTIRGLLSTTA